VTSKCRLKEDSWKERAPPPPRHVLGREAEHTRSKVHWGLYGVQDTGKGPLVIKVGCASEQAEMQKPTHSQELWGKCPIRMGEGREERDRERATLGAEGAAEVLPFPHYHSPWSSLLPHGHSVSSGLGNNTIRNLTKLGLPCPRVWGRRFPGSADWGSAGRPYA
jgi:hypothetical protein